MECAVAKIGVARRGGKRHGRNQTQDEKLERPNLHRCRTGMVEGFSVFPHRGTRTGRRSILSDESRPSENRWPYATFRGRATGSETSRTLILYRGSDTFSVEGPLNTPITRHSTLSLASTIHCAVDTTSRKVNLFPSVERATLWLRSAVHRPRSSRGT